jgi:Nif-specific ferredoxin III
MLDIATPSTRDGRNWKPSYLLSISTETCIGCGRCHKVCGRNVMTLKGIDEDHNIVELDDEDAEIERKIMVVVDEGACIGCSACSRVCPKDCQTHGPG